MNHSSHNPPISLQAERLTSDGQLTLTAAAEITAEDGDVGRFTIDAYSGGLMYPRLTGIGWDGPVVISISGIRANGVIPIHRDHDRSRPVGHGSVTMGERITCKGEFSVDNDDSRMIRSSSRNGFPWRGSVGLSSMLYEIADEGQVVRANGREFEGPVLHVIEADLDEVSFVSIAGDPNVSPAVAANKSSGARTMNFSAWLKSKGWDEATLTDAQKQTLRASFEAEVAADEAAADEAVAEITDEGDEPAADDDDADGITSEYQESESVEAGEPVTAAAGRGSGSRRGGRVSPTVQRARAEAAREQSRIDAIRSIGETIGNPVVEGNTSLVAHAIAQGWDANRTALYATRHSRPQSPAIHSTSRNERGSMEALQAGIMLRAGRRIDTVMPRHNQTPDWMSLPVNDPNRQRVMDNAHEFADLEMIDYVAHGLQAMGHRHSHRAGRSGRLATLQAGFSTGAVADIFTQSIGAMALATYMESGDFSRGWTSEADNPNLIATDRPRMQAGQDLTKHDTGGEADHVSRSANNETVKVDRYSQQAEIDENDFINDRFGLLRDTPVDFGRAAARLRPNLVASILLANANLSDSVALFAAGHSNVLTGSALSATTLRSARSKISLQKDGDASLNLPATHLIVPSDLGDLAVQLTMSAVISNDSGAGATNPLRMRNIMPVEEARLSNGLVNPDTGASLAGSATTWYLVSAEGHTIEVQFLEGTGRVPIVTVTQLTGGKFGLNITCKHFMGAKALDYRAMVRATA